MTEGANDCLAVDLLLTATRLGCEPNSAWRIAISVFGFCVKMSLSDDKAKCGNVVKGHSKLGCKTEETFLLGIVFVT